jgi:cation:H+ antiporter
VGIAAVMFGADMLVHAAIAMARSFGLSEVVIGLTLVAVGTCLPELATSVVAVFRGHGDVAFGNVVGRNIFNILGISGITAAVTPLPVASQSETAAKQQNQTCRELDPDHAEFPRC